MNSDKPNEIALDLDALSPREVEIKFKDKLIHVTPPSVEQYMQIIQLSNEMDATDMTKNTEAYSKVASFIKEVIPDLADDNLNLLQITALFKLLAELSAPNDDAAVAELKKRGINLRSADGAKSPKASASQPS